MEPNGRFFQITSKGIFTLSALLFVALLLWLSAAYPPRARYVPQVVAVFSLICLLIQLALDSLPRLAEFYRRVEKKDVFSVDEKVKGARGDDGPELRLEVVAYAWLAALLGALFLFGFLISIPLYVLFFLRLQAQFSWLKAVLFGLGTWLFVYLLFVRLFEIRLYAGILIETFLDL